MSESEHSDLKVDVEKAVEHKVSVQEGTEVARANDGVNRETSMFGKMWALVLYLDKFGVEMSANFTISTFSLGTLAKKIWHMELIDACLTILFFNLLCTIPVAHLGKVSTGLRQMVIGRYSFGTIGIYFPILLNFVACVGWSTINAIVGASALRAVSTGHQIPIAAGIVLIAVLTMVVALFGYRHVHMFERYASIPIVIIFIIMLGQATPHFSTGLGGVGEAEAASVLSFGAAVAGFSLGWTSLAADYTVNLPADTSDWKVFI